MEILTFSHNSTLFLTPTVVEEGDFAKRYAIQLRIMGLLPLDISERMGVDPIQVIRWLKDE